MARPIWSQDGFLRPSQKGPARSPVRGDNEAEPRRQSKKIIGSSKIHSSDSVPRRWVNSHPIPLSENINDPICRPNHNPAVGDRWRRRQIRTRIKLPQL